MTSAPLTSDRIRQGLLRRLYRAKTWWLRKVSNRPSEEEQLRRRILDRVAELGRWYEDGNSDLVEFTYHPILFPGFETVKSHRGEMADRLAAITTAIGPTQGEWILDIGANVGYFAFSLERQGAYVEAYESNSDTFEIGAALSKLHRTNVLYLNKSFGTAALAYLRPRYKAVLLLSVFHWIVKQEGITAATTVLSELARRTDQIFFETPCTESEGMFQHEIFGSQLRVEGFLQDALPTSKVSRLTVDQSWGGRNLYKIVTRSDIT